MRDWFRWVPVGLLVGGGALIGLALYQGTAQVSLVVIFPVITGASLFFLLGVLLLACGFMLLPIALGFTFGVDDEDEAAAQSAPAARSEVQTETAAGGVLLIGPVPILFGKWGRATPWAYVAFALVGLALTLLAVFLVLFV